MAHAGLNRSTELFFILMLFCVATHELTANCANMLKKDKKVSENAEETQQIWKIWETMNMLENLRFFFTTC